MQSRLTLDNLLRDDRDIYVYNNSGKYLGTKGVVHLSLIDGTGKTRPLTIPRTWLPINLTERVGNDILRNAYDLRGMLAKKVLLLEDPDHARDLLGNEDAREEMNRLYMEETNQRSISRTWASQEQDTKVLSPEMTAKMHTTGLNPMTTEDGVNPRVRDILLRVESEELSPRLAVAEIRSLASDLRTEDASYIISTAGDQQIKDYAKQLLLEKSNDVQNPFANNEPVPHNESHKLFGGEEEVPEDLAVEVDTVPQEEVKSSKPRRGRKK